MIDSYWDLYVAYIDKCVRNNWANDIDPAHYQMEWNHFLPKCVFGDWPIGQWLTKRQHAIASALQTLAFEANCMYGEHRQFLPDVLFELAWVYYKEQCKNNGKKTANLKTGFHSPGTASFAGKVGGRKAAETNRKNKTGIFDPEVRELACSTRRKPLQVTSLTTGETLIFGSLTEASLSLQVNSKNLSKVCNGLRKQAGGYTAKFISP